MNDFERYRRHCIMGIKAFQNIHASYIALRRLCDLTESRDHLLLSSLFQIAIIRYAKPFLNSKIAGGKISYPLRHLKNESGFVMSIHEHILGIRDTLVAHDDFEQIEPRILLSGISLRGIEFTIPTHALISNKCIGYPSDLADVQKMSQHVNAALGGVYNMLYSDLGRLRQIAIEHPDQAKAAQKYSKHYGSEHVPAGGKTLTPPDFSKDPFLNVEVPNFSSVHNGFRYETATVRREFFGPETINLPNGEKVEISPAQPNLTSGLPGRESA